MQVGCMDKRYFFHKIFLSPSFLHCSTFTTKMRMHVLKQKSLTKMVKLLSSYSFFVNCNAFLMSLYELDFPYIKTPPRYTRAPKIASIEMVAIRITIPVIASQVGIESIPTRKNIIIGVKKGI